MVLIFNDKFSEQLQEDVCAAVNLFSDHLFSPKLSKHIVIELELKNHFKHHGDCDILEYNSQRKARTFKIRLRNKKSHKSFIKTLAHELVHVKQYALGEMSEFHDLWKDGVDHKDTPYYDLPWEIEARTMEHILYDKYKSSGLPKRQESVIIEDNAGIVLTAAREPSKLEERSSNLPTRSIQEYYGISLSSDICSSNALQEQHPVLATGTRSG